MLNVRRESVIVIHTHIMLEGLKQNYPFLFLLYFYRKTCKLPFVPLGLDLALTI